MLVIVFKILFLPRQVHQLALPYPSFNSPDFIGQIKSQSLYGGQFTLSTPLINQILMMTIATFGHLYVTLFIIIIIIIIIIVIIIMIIIIIIV